jgi:hypothetical protein
MRDMYTTIARVWLISAVVLCPALFLRADEIEPGFRTLERIEQVLGADSPATYSAHGVRLEVLPEFSKRKTTSAAAAVLGFHIAIHYDDGVQREQWLEHEFIGNNVGRKESFGPFADPDGTGFLVIVHVHSTRTEARLEFQLASDGIVEKPEPSADAHGFDLLYDAIEIPAVSAAKKMYSIYSNVTLVIDIAKLATGVISPQSFAATFLIGLVADYAVNLIPSEYDGLVGYSCRNCGLRQELSDFHGCRTLSCPRCPWNHVEVCRRNTDQ